MKRNPLLVLILVVFTAVSLQADELVTPSGTLSDSAVTYTVTGDVATQSGGANRDLRLTTNSGGSFTVTFSQPVDLSFGFAWFGELGFGDSSPSLIKHA